MGTWSEWARINGPTSDNTIDYKPAVTSPGPNRLSLFVVREGVTYFRPWEASKGWGSWVNMDGVATYEAAATGWPPNHLEVYVRGNDWRLYGKYSDDGGASWSAWLPAPLPSNLSLDSGPAVAARDPNHVDVFFRVAGGNIYRTTRSGSQWSAPENVGCCYTSAPSLAYQFGQPWIYLWEWKAGTPTGQTWVNNWSATTNRWAGWRFQTASHSVPIVAVVPPTGTFYYFYMDNGSITGYYFNNRTRRWETTVVGFTPTGQISGVYPPAVVSRAPGTIDLFVRDYNGGLWYRFYRE